MPPRAARPITSEPSRDLAARVLGPIIAIAMIASWATFLIVGFQLDIASTSPLWSALLLLASTLAHTGLFITAHDAMHGTVSPTSKPLNHALGRIAAFCYALFDYRRLLPSHMRHHRFPGTEHDPDFHDENHPGFLRWYFRFAFGYVRWYQIVGMAIIFNILHHLVGIPLPNLLLFWVVPALLSTLQLFTFGTWLPHRSGPDLHHNDHHARSNAFPAWLSFLTCFHFGYHLEHHEHPAVPWWRLPRVHRDREIVRQGGPCDNTIPAE